MYDVCWCHLFLVSVVLCVDPGVEGAAGPGLPADFKGMYELFAVVTHKGREADGGRRRRGLRLKHSRFTAARHFGFLTAGVPTSTVDSYR